MELEVKDRVAIGDNKYIITNLEDGRVQLEPSPDTVEEEGTPINKELLQPLVDAVPVIFDLSMDSETNTLTFQNGQTAEQLITLLDEDRNVIVRFGSAAGYNVLSLVNKIRTPITGSAYTFQLFFSSTLMTFILTESGFSQGISTIIGDYVIVEGNTNGWTYRKWASGVAEIWGVFNTTYSTTLVAGGNYAVTSDVVRVDLPENLFEKSPVVELTPMGGGYPAVVIANVYNTHFTFTIRTEWAVNNMPIWLQVRCIEGR